MASNLSEQKRKRTPDADHDWHGATVIDEKPSLPSQAIVFVYFAALILSTLAFGMVDGWALALFMLAAGAMGWLWLADAWATGEFKFGFSSLQLPIIALIVIGLVQLLPLGALVLPENLLAESPNNALTLDPYATRLALAQLVAMLIFFASALTFINNQARLQNLTTLIIVFGFLLSIFAVIQYFGGEGWIYGIRKPVAATPFGPFVNRHNFGAFIEMPMALTLGLLLTGAVGREQRALHVFALVVMGIGLILTSSRSSFLSLSLLIIFLNIAVFFNRTNTDDESAGEPNSNRRWLSLGGSAALVVLIIGAVVFLGNNEWLRSVGLNSPEQDVSSGRFQFWTTTLEIIRDNWLLGVGLEAFQPAYTRYDVWTGAYIIDKAHNDYLQMFAEAGIFGFAAILAFIFLLFRQGWKTFQNSNDRFRRGVAIGGLGGCFALLINSLFDFPLHIPSILLMFLTFAVLAVGQINYPKLHKRHRSKN